MDDNQNTDDYYSDYSDDSGLYSDCPYCGALKRKGTVCPDCNDGYVE